MPSVRNMQPSDWLLAFMAVHEGCELNAYQIILSSDPLTLDYPTYGFGVVIDFNSKWKTQCAFPAGQYKNTGKHLKYTGNDPKFKLKDMAAAMKQMRDKLSKSFVPNIRKCFALEGFPDFELTQNQFDAIVSRVWNCGAAISSRTSPLRCVVHAICHYGVYSDQTMFVMSGPCTAQKKVLKGLVMRRREEINMFRGHWNPREAKFAQYLKYLGLNPASYHADGVNGAPVTDGDIEKITKQWYQCAKAFVPCKKTPPDGIEQSDAAKKFVTGWVGIGMNAPSTGAVTTGGTGVTTVTETTDNDGNTYTTATVTPTSSDTAITSTKDGHKTTVKMGNGRESVQGASAAPVSNAEDEKERQRLIEYIMHIEENKRNGKDANGANGKNMEGDTIKGVLQMPGDMDAIRKKLEAMTVKELQDYSAKLGADLTEEGAVNDIEQRTADKIEEAEPVDLKEMETPERDDVEVPEEPSDTPNVDAALADLMADAPEIPGLTTDAIIDALLEKLDSLVQPVKPYIEMIEKLQKEYDETEGDNAKEKIKAKLEKEKERLKNQIEALKNKIRDDVQNAIDTIKNAFRQLKEILQNIKDMCVACIKIMAMPGAIGPVSPNPMKNAADAKVVAMSMNNMLGMATTPCIQICQAAKQIHYDLPQMITSVMSMVGTTRQTVQSVITAASALGA